jgi:hypothetical protein
MPTRALVLSLVIALAACRPPSTAPAAHATPPERPRVAVLAFRLPDGSEPAGDLGFSLARKLASHLAEAEIPVASPDEVFGAMSLADAGHYDAPLARSVARKVGANLAVLGTLDRWRDRVGTAWAVEQPASVAYDTTLVRAADGATVTVDRFDYTQQALTSNLLDLPRFLRGRGRWLTAEEIADGALDETADRFAVALGRPPRAR